eukprot:98672-Pyramimonas_sp.AAC.1
MLEEKTFRASKRAQNRAAASSLKDFQQWFSSLDSKGQVFRSLKDPDPERDEFHDCDGSVRVHLMDIVDRK